MAKVQAGQGIFLVIKMCREAAGLSQEYIAKKCGCSQSMIALVEKGERELTYRMLRVYAKEIGEPWSHIILSAVKEDIAMTQGA